MHGCQRKSKLRIQILSVHTHFNIKMVIGASLTSKLQEYQNGKSYVFAIALLRLIVVCSSLFCLLLLSSSNTYVPRYVPLLKLVKGIKELDTIVQYQ